ncbi:hypothetical protein, partial [Frankia sp. AgB32]|uniref:hypothetical protein n=1 Tax=Frankia sp. AgB32 TaxID=631119 RepID=UPI00200C8C3C
MGQRTVWSPQEGGGLPAPETLSAALGVTVEYRVSGCPARTMTQHGHILTGRIVSDQLVLPEVAGKAATYGKPNAVRAGRRGGACLLGQQFYWLVGRRCG